MRFPAGKALRVGIGTEYSTSLDNRRKVGGDAEVYGQKSGSGRLRADNRSGTDSTAISETSEKQNKVKADSAESAFTVGEVKRKSVGARRSPSVKSMQTARMRWRSLTHFSYEMDKHFVRAAEKLAQNCELDKKEYVVECLQRIGVKVTPVVDALIEAAVEELDIAIGKAGKDKASADDADDVCGMTD